MKKKIISLVLSFAVLISFMPFMTIQADAFSTGSKTLVKTRTVTIKPGKTYKTPVFKLSKKMALVVPIQVWLSPKDKGKTDYIKSGKYKLTLKTKKGKTIDSFSDSLKYVDRKDMYWYDNWIYYFNKSISKPCFSKGKYYYTIKNTTKRTIKVRYSVKGYTKFATEAEFVEEKEIEQDIYEYVGRIGPGIPAIDSIESSNENVYISWDSNPDGTFYIMAEGQEEDTETIVTITLKGNGAQYQIKLKVLGYGGWYDDEDI